ncbi:MAG: hypothetical protein BroJett025_10670 [Patescibacteria group bacterium]|nr:MAG: hypothetical protein BroJett025_10670 [Patescibacteria group bacterium]
MFRIRDYHLHLPHITFDNTKDLRLLYAVRVFRDLGNKMAMFFLPVYLYLVGSTATALEGLPFSSFQRGMIVLALFYIGFGSIGFFIGIPTGKLYKKIGYQRTFLFSFLLRCLFFVSVFFAKQNIWFLVPAVILDAINAQMFWPGYYSLISKNSLKKNLGKDVGFLHTMIQIVAVIAPAISGFLALVLGIEVLFLVGLVLTLVSAIFTFNMQSKTSINAVSYKDFFVWMKETRFRQLAASFSGKYVYDVSVYIWPLYIFLLLGSVDRVGYLYTVSLFLAMAITYFTGSYIDNHKSKKPFYFSGGILSLVTVLRAQVATVVGIALVDLADRLISNVYTVYFDTMFMLRSKGHSVDEFFIYREMVVNVATVIFWLFALVFFIFFSGWTSLYVFAGIGVLVGLLMKDSKHE